MAVLLALIVLVYLKNNLFYDNHSQFTYLLALGVPGACLLLTLAFQVYDKYLSKIQQSHSSTYVKLTSLIVLVTICLLSALLLFCLFLENPGSQKSAVYLALAPFYVAYLVLLGFFIYISPGLTNPINGIEGYQYLLAVIYLIFLAVYPPLYAVCAWQEGGEGGEGK
mmetsp:Transcript_2985/g.5052  ORF Transcript_2985/g.5052 Transcript_2985/m.5052 type:complete len:167 (-) Transcript_2985:462-962(-)|eukprot:CAMPEP_0168620406 /NCGR_PEP_ID=MMETSP0449_2-20121227/7119_1 /TAXON_ID=1082188 /ORGANISM="Strombidium rassoulzadegani, Strain ras09" /LENGTH=166 /DNA_ID=CAMNT_0008661407 /DNA_START=564 /DNA_END=1064 /DNA_ORIENTATION=-